MLSCELTELVKVSFVNRCAENLRLERSFNPKADVTGIVGLVEGLLLVFYRS